MHTCGENDKISARRHRYSFIFSQYKNPIILVLCPNPLPRFPQFSIIPETLLRVVVRDINLVEYYDLYRATGALYFIFYTRASVDVYVRMAEVEFGSKDNCAGVKQPAMGTTYFVGRVNKSCDPCLRAKRGCDHKLPCR